MSSEKYKLIEKERYILYFQIKFVYVFAKLERVTNGVVLVYISLNLCVDQNGNTTILSI